ncbi:MAG: response regulator transcription factor [Chloroflexi bacterium]|nr:response regulator transcription factor [Chloroflexota bacterium]
MSSVSIVSENGDQIRDLVWGLVQSGFACSAVLSPLEAVDQLPLQSADVVLIHMDEAAEGSTLYELPQRIKEERQLPIITLVSRDALGTVEYLDGIDDFVVEPWNAAEVVSRIKRVLSRRNDVSDEGVIRCGDLVIDQAKCEVTLSGKLVELTFREYELLRFLASATGRVFSRDALLSQVWGYDYFGGDRTVDVHIRRLRSKIEDANHTFIETVRNIGYRFRQKDPMPLAGHRKG